jgi:PAS domain S-box-containing protein
MRGIAARWSGSRREAARTLAATAVCAVATLALALLGDRVIPVDVLLVSYLLALAVARAVGKRQAALFIVLGPLALVVLTLIGSLRWPVSDTGVVVRACAVAAAGALTIYALPRWLTSERTYKASALRLAGRAEAVMRLHDELDARMKTRTNELSAANASLRAEIAGHAISQEALRQREKSWRAVVDSALDAVISIDARGVIAAWNPRAVATFGWTAEEAIGARLADLIVPARHRHAHMEGVGRTVATGGGALLDRRVEIEALRRDGTEFPVELAITVDRSAGAPVFNAFVRDISERRRLEDAQRRLVESQAEFVTLVSHELRAPLATLSGGFELIERHAAALPPRTGRTIEIMAKETARLARLVESILELARSNAGDVALAPASVPMDKVIARAATAVSESDPGHRIEMRLPDRLPAVWADELSVEHTLRNLVSNAAKYSRPGTPIRIEAQPQADVLLVSVTDHGPGIDEEQRERIFDAFYRVPRDADSTSGFGLGLYLARKLVQAHGGTITVDSPAFPDRSAPGARFTVTLPLAKKAA